MDTKTMTILELREECDGLLDFLRGLGYTEGTMTNFRRALASLIAFAEGNGEPFSLDLLIEGYSDLIRSKGIGDHSKTALLGHLRRLVDRIKGKPFSIAPSHSPAEAPICFRPILEAYLGSRRDKGNKDNTLLSKRVRVASFLSWIGSSGARDLSAFGADEVISFLGGKPAGFHTALRDFLSYLFREGTQKLDLSFFVRFPGRPQRAPTSYSSEELSAIESAMGGSPRDVRNRAAFLLASELGMRSGDIVRLRLCDVDIPSSRVSFVQMKNGRPMSLPLTEKAAEAMKAWLAIRPGCPSEEVFVRVMHPVTPRRGKSGGPRSRRRR